MRRFWKILKCVIYIILGVFVLDLSVVLFFGFYRPVLKKADAIVVLGAAINTPELYQRSLQGLKLYQEGFAPVIVLSGGQDYANAEPEAEFMEKVVESNSSTTVPIIIEDQSHSTYDNIKNSENLIGHGKSIIVVSDNYHLARGVLVAAREGFHPIYWSSPSSSYYSKPELAFYYGREVFAMLDYIPKFILG
jgi:uncharacterized SAM-binding protein YcdF (DUF218 family)